MRINVAYACDENYIMQTGISMISLFENNITVDEIVVYLIDFGISKDSLTLVRRLAEKYNRSLEVISFDLWRNDLHVNNLGRHIESVYAKIFFGRIDGIDKILYLDSDIIVTDSLERLWNMDLSQYWIAGVETISSESRNQKMDIEAADICINDGMLLMNLENWRADHVEEKCFQYIEQKNGDPFVLSEGTLNKVCQNHILKLHPRYNLMSGLVYYSGREITAITGREFYSEEELREAVEKPCIVHFLCGYYLRPWQSNCRHPLKKYYGTYKAMSPWKDEKGNPGKLKLKLKLVDILHRMLPWKVFCKLIVLSEQKN